MCGIAKTLIRVGLITAVVGGTVVVFAGPHRVRALVQQARSDIHARIDAAIDDPAALRAQLKDLEAQYPKRLAEVRRDLDEVQGQIAQLEREAQVSRRVVALAETDLTELQTLLARADEHRQTGQATVVRVKFEDQVLTPKQAYARAGSITQVRDAYQNRAGEIEKDLGYLRQQEQRLSDVLVQLDTEHAEFQAQLWQLDRQVDAISRNERLIAIMEKREARIAEHSRYEGVSLDRLRGRLASIRSGQESRLDRLAGSLATRSYEDRARLDAARETNGYAPLIELDSPVIIDSSSDQELRPARRLASRPN
ncbi:MAG: hypothetical protein KF866_05125 [Phycisphaeraceae bacterium]|nr:hypothetical protein [Phycisphaeraceae bacterium]MCW5754374.1 hypothetical protein [Phycisphaeraceae bacterium]